MVSNSEDYDTHTKAMNANCDMLINQVLVVISMLKWLISGNNKTDDNTLIGQFKRYCRQARMKTLKTQFRNIINPINYFQH